MELDAVFLSRLQFAFTIMFHYLFPPLSIGLGFMMVIMEGMYLKTGNKEYESIARFLTGIFAVVFAMGVASGIVMEFQFGTNWSKYSRFVGDVFGSALAAEGIFAFFLESGFLAVLVFGWDRVSSKMHFFSTVMVEVGAVFSSIWITVANSWQQTPAGYHLVEYQPGLYRAEITDFWAMVFNPSSVHRLVHVWLAALVLGAFFLLSISSYYILKNRHEGPAKKMFTLALWVALISSIAIPISGHFQAINVAETQPAKMAAFEGHFETGDGGTALYLFGIPNEKQRKVNMSMAIPGMLSFLIHGDFNEPVAGLDQFAEENWPPVNLTFQSYHMMVALGMFFIGVTGLAAFLHWRGTLFKTRWLLWIFVFAVIGPYIANELGWVAAEVGRQPWIVYGLLRTEDAISPSVSGAQVLGSIIMFSLVYLMLFIIWLFIMDKKIRKGPEIKIAEGPKEGFFKTASQLADPAGPSLTGVKKERKEKSSRSKSENGKEES